MAERLFIAIVKNNNMGLLGKLFSNKKSTISKNNDIVFQSKIPEHTSIGNLVFEKKYEEAIELGKNLLIENPSDCGVHVNLMDAYFKSRNNNLCYLDLSTHHAKQAMLNGHNTGYAQKRLVINLEKTGKINQAIQLCDIVLSQKFNFSSHGCGNKQEYENRREKLINKKSKSFDSDSEQLFTTEELNILYRKILINNKAELKQRAESEKFKQSFDNWYGEEEESKRVERLKNALYGDNQN